MWLCGYSTAITVMLVVRDSDAFRFGQSLPIPLCNGYATLSIESKVKIS
jgi:hypothetical protein